MLWLRSRNYGSQTEIRAAPGGCFRTHRPRWRVPGHCGRRGHGRATGTRCPDGTAPAQHLDRRLCRCLAWLRLLGPRKEPGNTINTDGFVGGGFLGYNYQIDNFVLGAEGDIGYGSRKGDNAGTEVKGGLDGSLRARLGYAVTPDILPYITAGGAAQSLKVTEGGVSDKNTMLGWTAGVGTDIKITEQVFGRVEYRYSDYGNKAFTTGSGTRDVDARDHRIQFGIGMKF